MENDSKFGFVESLYFLSKYIKKYRKYFVRFYIGWLFESISTILLPALFGIMLDESVYRRNVDSFIRVSIMVGLVSLLSIGLFFLIYSQQHYIFTMVSFEIRQDVFSHMMKCNISYLLTQNSGELVNLLSYYPEECVHFIIRGIIHQINRVITTVILIIALFRLNLWIGIIVSIGSVCIYLLSLLCGKLAKRYSGRYREHYDKFISWMYEMLDGAINIHVLNSMDFINEKFKKKHKDLFRESNHVNYINTAADSLAGFLNLIAQILIYVVVGYLVLNGKLSIGIFTMVLAYYNILKKNILDLNRAYMEMTGRIAVIKKIYEFLNVETEDTWPGKENLIMEQGEIEFKNVSFGYSNEQSVLVSSSFHIDSNEKVAVVGKSGIGKSTLSHLLIGMFQPSEGEILIDGKNLLTFSLKSIRKQIGVLEQDIFLFDGTILYNLKVGNLQATQEEIELACEKAGILSFIQSLETGFGTVLGRKGINLSGGQKQRIGIARLYLRKTKIMIFDESTSALDEETEKEIIAYWRNEIKNSTVLIISHKLSAIGVCERGIMVNDDHTTVEDSMEQFKEKNEAFRTLFRLGGNVC